MTYKCAKCGKQRWDSDPAVLNFMRHGRTKHNELSICTGSLDEPLSEAGMKQSSVTAHDLRGNGYVITAIVSSPMKRACQTAEFFSAVFGHDILTDNRLRERCVGVLEGQPETLEIDKQLLRSDYLPEGATPLGVFERETNIFLDDCAKGDYISGTLFVTHSLRILTIVKLIKGLRVEEIQRSQIPDNCELVTFGVTHAPCSHCRSSCLIMEDWVSKDRL